ncbi:hypothetical protein TNCT1_67910 [Streptomyces sp. 1-11]|nr:hypothetical protein TNCT1_67910 [Streptomyces sp. 1-11]
MEGAAGCSELELWRLARPVGLTGGVQRQREARPRLSSQAATQVRFQCFRASRCHPRGGNRPPEGLQRRRRARVTIHREETAGRSVRRGMLSSRQYGTYSPSSPSKPKADGHELVEGVARAVVWHPWNSSRPGIARQTVRDRRRARNGADPTSQVERV